MDGSLHSELVEALALAGLPPIPTALRPGMSDVEFALFYIAQKDANERRIAAQRPHGVSWSGLTDDSHYTPKTHAQMVMEAERQVAPRCADIDREFRDAPTERDVEALLAERALLMAAE